MGPGVDTEQLMRWFLIVLWVLALDPSSRNSGLSWHTRDRTEEPATHCFLQPFSSSLLFSQSPRNGADRRRARLFNESDTLRTPYLLIHYIIFTPISTIYWLRHEHGRFP